MASFREEYQQFQQLDTEILAISADSLDSHRKFSEVLGGIPFPMLSDTEGEVIRLYGVAKEQGTGLKRSVFVLDRDGRIIHANTEYSVSNPRHFEAILEALKK